MAELLQKMKAYLSLVTVEPILFIYMMIIFLETNALQSLIYTKVCLEMYNPGNKSECDHQSSQNLTDAVHKATMWTKYYSGCLFFCTLLISFYVASWSDYLGRKVVMIIPVFGSLLASAVNTTLSIFLNTTVAYFFVSAAVSGFTFGTVGIIASTFGYISDITSEESRTKRIIVLEAMIFSGGTLGIYVAGAILKNLDLNVFFNNYAQVFTLEMALTAFIIAYIIIRIPSHRNEVILTEHSITFQKLFSLIHLKDVAHTIFRKRDGKKRKHILLLLLALMLIYFGSAVQFTLAFLFVKNEPLKWNITQYTQYSSVQFAVEGVALLFGLPLVFHFYHVPDSVVAMVGLVSRTAGFVLYGFSTTKAMIFSCAALYVFSEYPVPAARSMLSKLVDKNEKGKIFAVTNILQNLCYLLSSLILTTVFQSSLSFFPGLCFEIIALLQAFAIVIFCYFHFASKEIVTSYETMENEDGDIEEKCCTSISTSNVKIRPF